MAVTRDEAPSVVEFFAGIEAGFFVEVGPGRIGSISAELEARGWTGVLIESQPHLAAFLVTARSAKVFAVACISPDQTGQTVALRVSGAAGAAPYVVLVPGRTLDDILAEAEAPAPVDLVAIDAPGREVDVLAGFDFEYWQPGLVLLRDRLESLRPHRDVTRHGYRLIRRLGGHGWYVPHGAPIGIPWSQRWRLARTYYLGQPWRSVRAAWRRLWRLMRMSASD